MARTELTDGEWELIEPFLPIGRFGPYPERLRQQFEGVLWKFRSGARWREMPSEFGAWQTVYDRFRRWRDAGVFRALMEGMITEAARGGQVDLSLVCEEVLTCLEEAAEASKGASRQGRSRPSSTETRRRSRNGSVDEGSGCDVGRG